MSKKNYYLVLDTETATLPCVNEIANSDKERKNIAIAKPLVYDVGWVIMDTKGNIEKKVNYLVQETFAVPVIFNTAYYADKRPLYIAMLKANTIALKVWNDIVSELLEDCKKCRAVCAYNAAFDFKKAIPFTERYIEAVYSENFAEFENKEKWNCKRIAKGQNDRKNPDYTNPVFHLRENDFDIIDIMDLAVNRILNSDKYRHFALNNGLITEGIQSFSATAENCYRYIHRNTDFIESHTALDDALIESEILVKILRKGKPEYSIQCFAGAKIGNTIDFAIEKHKKSIGFLIDSLSKYLVNRIGDLTFLAMIEEENPGVIRSPYYRKLSTQYLRLVKAGVSNG
jgi:hypothetical protein